MGGDEPRFRKIEWVCYTPSPDLSKSHVKTHPFFNGSSFSMREKPFTSDNKNDMPESSHLKPIIEFQVFFFKLFCCGLWVIITHRRGNGLSVSLYLSHLNVNIDKSSENRQLGNLGNWRTLSHDEFSFLWDPLPCNFCSGQVKPIHLMWSFSQLAYFSIKTGNKGIAELVLVHHVSDLTIRLWPGSCRVHVARCINHA